MNMIQFVHSRICGCAVICQKGRSKVLQWQTAMQTVRRRVPHFCKMGPTMQSGWIVGGLALLFAVIGSVESSCTVTPAKVETTCKLA